jgi:T5SS/PEP-CTERM-associated repeat protein
MIRLIRLLQWIIRKYTLKSFRTVIRTTVCILALIFLVAPLDAAGSDFWTWGDTNPVFSGTGDMSLDEGLIIGDIGNGGMAVTSGGAVSSQYGYIARSAGSTGEVNIDGAGSIWANSGDLTVGYGGAGSLNITNNGLVEIGGQMELYNEGVVNLAGGDLSVNTLEMNQGSAIIGSGQILTEAGLNLGQGGSLDGSGDGLTLWGDLFGSGNISNTAIYGDVNVGQSPGLIEMTDVDLLSCGFLLKL